MLLLFAVVSVLVCGVCDAVEPKFAVLSPNEILVKIKETPQQELITLRIGVQRNGKNLEDIEHGVNFAKNGVISILDDRLQLRKGDIINYLLAFKNDKGYQAYTGKYIFDGEYKRIPNGRTRRSIESTTELQQDHTDEKSTNIESRFGYGRGHHFNNPHGPHGKFQGHNPHFGPGFGPGFGPRGPPPPFMKPNFHHGCNGGHSCHGHGHGHGHGNGFGHGHGHGYHHHNHQFNAKHKPCSQESDESSEEQHNWPDFEVSTSTTSTTTEFPDIDIRFAES